MDLDACGGFWRTNLRCRRWVLELCSARAGGVCSFAPRATKRSCPELKHVHADPPRQVSSFHGRGGQRPEPRRRCCQPRTSPDEAMMLTLLERINPDHGTTFTLLR
ncbi:hypothetical protein VPH35_004120 [Triticum aestivum]